MKKYLFFTLAVFFSHSIFSQYIFVSEQSNARMFGDGFGFVIDSQLPDFFLQRTEDDWLSSEQVATFDGNILSYFSIPHMFNSNEGFVYGTFNDNYVWKTTDGGLTWNSFTDESNIIEGVNVAVEFINPELIYTIILDATNGNYYFQKINPDSVETLFEMDQLVGSPASQAFSFGFKMDFLNAEFGILAKYDDNQNTQLYRINSSQMTWEPIAEEFSGRVQDIHIQNENDLFICGDDGLILRSIDGGETWIQSQLGLNNINSINFINSEKGFAGGNEGEMFKTIDGGISWTSESTGTTGDIRHIDIIDQEILYISGFDFLYKKQIISNVNELDADEHLVRLYPNPAQNEIHLIGDNVNGQLEWFILDSAGKKILEGSERNIDISSLATGLYVINSTLDDKNARTKFIKK